MQLIAKLFDLEGAPLEEATVEVRIPGRRSSLVKEKVLGGKLALELPESAASTFGLLVDGRPVLTVPVRATAKRIDLGEITIGDEPLLSMPAFPARDGAIYGLPRALREELAPPAALAAGATLGEDPSSLSAVLTSVGEQISKVDSQLTGTAYKLGRVTLRLKGVATQDAEGTVTWKLITPEDLGSVSGDQMSEVEASYNTGESPAASPVSAKTPAVVGYTRQLAERKLRSAGFHPEVSYIYVTDPAQADRVVRQMPAAGVTTTERSVRLYFGKNERSS